MILASGEKLQFGLCSCGLEDSIEKYLKMVCERFSTINFFEVGTAFGHNLMACAKILSENSKDWIAIGLDIPDWAFGGQYDKQTIQKIAKGLDSSIEIFDSPVGMTPKRNMISLFLVSSSDFFTSNLIGPIHFAFIDGCHCKTCAMLDFTLVEKFVPVGGLVAFHDFGENSVGQLQSYLSHGPANVIGACKELGLVDGGRKGWKFLDHVKGDIKGYVRGETLEPGLDLGVFERINDND
jgi:hypothetical protein